MYNKSRFLVFLGLLSIIIVLTGSLPLNVASAATFAGGSGTVEDPYQIATPEQFNRIRNHTSSHFVLVSDIDLSAYSWSPVSYFTGSLNGNGFTINNISITSLYHGQMGLFISLGATSAISNLAIENIQVTGGGGTSIYAGALAIHNQGTITNCRVGFSIDVHATTAAYAGGMVYTNSGTIENSVAHGTVYAHTTTAAYAGGMVYTNSGTISNSIAHGTVRTSASTASFIGGMAGSNSGIVFHSYSAASVIGSGGGVVYAGGLMRANSGEVISSYYDRNTSGRSDTGKGVGKTTAEMKQRATFIGWDFMNTWKIGENVSYATLQWQPWTEDEEITHDINSLTWDVIGGNSTVEDLVTGDLHLPDEGPRGSTLTWSVVPDDVVLDPSTGKVTRPVYPEPSEALTLSATASKGSGNTQIVDRNLIIQFLPKALTVTGSFTAQSKTYDGTGNVILDSDTMSLEGVVGEDDVVLVPALAYSDPSAGTSKVVFLTGYSSLSGADADNYSLSLADAPSGNADIMARILTVGGTFTVHDKVYDGTVEATVDTNSLTLLDIVADDDVVLSPAAVFSDAGVSSGLSVSLTVASGLAGAKANNYALSLEGAPTTMANINTKALNVVAEDKSKSEGASDPIFTARYEGLAVGDDESSLDGELVFHRETGESPGSYAITPAGLVSTNYVINFSSGQLAILSANALLSELLLEGTGIWPVFGPAVHSYAAVVPYSTSSVTVKAVAESIQAAILVNNVVLPGNQATISLPVGTMVISIVVTAEDGTATHTYSVAVTRLPFVLQEELPAPPPPQQNIEKDDMGRVMIALVEPEVNRDEDGNIAEDLYQVGVEAAEHIRLAASQGVTGVHLNLGESEWQSPTSRLVVSLPLPVLNAMAEGLGMTITVTTPAVSLKLPAELVLLLSEQGHPLEIALSRHGSNLPDFALPPGIKAVAPAVTINTSLRGLTAVSLPLNLELPGTVSERESFLNRLRILAIHSDGDRGFISGLNFGIDETVSPPVLREVSFLVDKFSSFTLVELLKWPLFTVVGEEGYTQDEVHTTMAACYYKANDTYMPVRMLEALGVELGWDQTSSTATLHYLGKTVQITIGSSDAYINGVLTPIRGASGSLMVPELAPGRTMIPLRFVSEHIGFEVKWHETHTVIISIP